MTNKLFHIAIILICLTIPTFSYATEKEEVKEVKTSRDERNLIREGNKLFEEKRYAEAEVKYRQAISANPDTEIGQYNLAVSLIKQSSTSDKLGDPASTIHKADSILKDFVTISKNKELVSKAYYNLGNIAFNEEQYAPSIEMYKNCLRKNPEDDKARENLRLAQKKLEEQQNQQQDQNKDKDKEEQEKEQQQQQDQNKDQNKDQQQQQNQNQEQKQDKQQQQEQQGAAPDNSEQILNAVQNNEKTTQQRVNAVKAQQEQQQRRRTKNQW